MKTLSPFVILVALLFSGHSTRAAEANPRAGLDFYLQTYGRIAQTDVADVYAVFDKVRAAADRNSMVSPRLVVIGDTRQAMAFALSDGTIVLSSKAIAIMRDSANRAEAGARMAFVLGHELAHLAANDFWDSQIAQALTASSNLKPGGRPAGDGALPLIELRSMTDSASGQQKKELKADDLGFLYAALAGFEVDTLLESARGAEDFLSFWNAQVGRRNDPNYPLAQERSGLLRLRLAELRNALNYYTFGVRLMHFGRYREAIAFFREFQQHYPSRELFNNLGYCHLQLAMSQLDPEYAYRYWLPMLSELDSPLSRLSVRSAGREDRNRGRMTAPARENLLAAVRYFEQAVEKDARYTPGYVNLSVARLLLGMHGESQGPLADDHLLRAKLAVGAALNLQAEETPTRMLAAIIDYELQLADRTDGGQQVRFASFANIDASDPAFLYNLAQLTAADSERSNRYWQRLVVQFGTLPRKMQALVCHREGLRSDSSPIANSCSALAPVATESSPPWALPIKLSRDLLQQPITQDELRRRSWQPVSLNVGAIYVGARDSVLAIDDIASLVTIKPDAVTTASLTQCCAQPLDKTSVVYGGARATLWHYGRWIALVRDSRVEEVWVTN